MTIILNARKVGYTLRLLTKSKLICYTSTVDDTECFKQQIAFDIAEQSGNIGKLMQRPVCDDEGFFKPLQCIPDEM